MDHFTLHLTAGLGPGPGPFAGGSVESGDAFLFLATGSLKTSSGLKQGNSRHCVAVGRLVESNNIICSMIFFAGP